MNPRLVEPGNAWRAGVDLVEALMRVSLGEAVPVAEPPRPGVRTHQLLLAVLGAAQHGGGRRGVARELMLAVARRGPYAGSAEELTPVRRDPLAAVPVAAAAIATLIDPGRPPVLHRRRRGVLRAHARGVGADHAQAVSWLGAKRLCRELF